MADEQFKAQVLAYADAVTRLVVDIEEIIDGRIDIDNNGNANPYMKIQIEIAALRLILGVLREYVEKDHTQ